MYNFSLKGNRKLGVMPVTRSPQINCPDTCTLKGAGCYAELGPMGWHWKDDSFKGVSFEELVNRIKQIKPNTLWRHNEAGDFAANTNGEISEYHLNELVAANKGKLGFTYTHHNPIKNQDIIKKSINNGFTINLSAETLTQADTYVSYNMAPVVVILPINAPKVSYTPKGNKVVLCPANGDITCNDCKLCQRSDRDFIIGFAAHGVRKNKVEKIALSMI